MTIESRLTALETITGAITEAQNDKVDLADGKTQSNVDYVVEWKVPTTSDTTWYRVYKSGWVEQGGIIAQKSHTGNANTSTAITFLKPFNNTAYNVIISYDYGGSYYSQLVSVSTNRTTSGFEIATWDNSSYVGLTGYMWRAEGMGA